MRAESYTVGVEESDLGHIQIGWKVPDGQDFLAKLTLQQAAKFWESLEAEVKKHGTLCSIEHEGVVYRAEMAPHELESFADEIVGFLNANLYLIKARGDTPTSSPLAGGGFTSSHGPISGPIGTWRSSHEKS